MLLITFKFYYSVSLRSRGDCWAQNGSTHSRRCFHNPKTFICYTHGRVFTTLKHSFVTPMVIFSQLWNTDLSHSRSCFHNFETLIHYTHGCIILMIVFPQLWNWFVTLMVVFSQPWNTDLLHWFVTLILLHSWSCFHNPETLICYTDLLHWFVTLMVMFSQLWNTDSSHSRSCFHNFETLIHYTHGCIILMIVFSQLWNTDCYTHTHSPVFTTPKHWFVTLTVVFPQLWNTDLLHSQSCFHNSETLGVLFNKQDEKQRKLLHICNAFLSFSLSLFSV